MSDLARERCFHHASREAVAKCLSCGRTFCRECVTEHEGRVICASCLQALTSQEEKKTGRLTAPFRLIQFAFGFTGVWFVFYLVGRLLLLIPSSFHEGTLWDIPGWTP